MTYRNLVRVINWLIKIANAVRLLHCRKHGECLCLFCTNDKCKNRDITFDNLILPGLQNTEDIVSNENENPD